MIKKEIEKFNPITEQEEVDKQYFLKFTDSFEDVLTRENIFGHISSSALVVNKEKTKILLVYHNIFNGYIFPGGHADGDSNFLDVAMREVNEETGVNTSPLSKDIFTIWTAPIKSHVKRGKFVPAHTHLDIVYLLEADENEKLVVKPDENQSVIWAPINELGKSIKLVDFFEPECNNLIAKLFSKKEK